jgi:hypothetical protein
MLVLMKIKHLKIFESSRFRNDEHFQFFYDVRNLITAIGAAALNILKEFEVFCERFNDEDTALKKIPKSAITDEIHAADEARDATYRGMVDTNSAALKHYDPEVVAAARRLKILFDTYGNLAIRPLNEETSGIINLLQELDGKYAEDVKTVNLTGWKTQLKTDNNGYIALSTERNNENAARTQLKMKECRLETEHAYEALVERVNALIVVEGEEKYADFVSKLNSLIDKYNNTVAQRVGRAKAKKNKKNEDKD